MTLYSSFGSRHVAAFVWSTWDHDPRKIPTVDTTIYHHLADYQIVVTTGVWTLPVCCFRRAILRCSSCCLQTVQSPWGLKFGVLWMGGLSLGPV